MPDPRQTHWEQAYTARGEQSLSWFEEHPTRSLALLDEAGVGPGDPVIDVGGGASRLVDALLERGHRSVTVLDVAAAPLELAKARLGPRASGVGWLVRDVTRWTPPPHAFALWHDRAVFHFLVGATDRAAYLRALDAALRPGGHAILATFAPSGPERCSGLPVQRYSAVELADALGPGFQLLRTEPATHRTPGGSDQDFTWCLFRKANGA